MKKISLFLIISFFFISCGSSNDDSIPSQKEFYEIITKYKKMYNTERKKDKYIDQQATVENIFNQRTEALKALLKDGAVKNWKGEIEKIAVYENQGAKLKVELDHDITLELPRHMVIGVNSTAYNNLRQYSEGSDIVFSGKFIPPDEKKDIIYDKAYFKEKSITKGGSMDEPEFLFLFTDIKNKDD